MSYYGDGIPYYYSGPFANHSSLMTGTGRIHTPLRYAPHLSTISESPLSTYRRYQPVVLPSSRPKRIIDTADIDVSSPRALHSSSHSNSPRNGHRLRRDRPTIRIRSQALKDNPALRDHYERHEKSVGELLVEKFFIKEKKSSDDLSKSTICKEPNLETDLQDQQEAIQKRVTRRMTRRRSSADIQMDPDQLEREIAFAQVQAEVLDNLVAEEQAEIEVETRKGTLIHKNIVRGGGLPKTSESDEEEISEVKRKVQKKQKKRKKTTDKPSPPSTPIELKDESKDKGKIFKVEACNSVGDFSTLWVNASENEKKLEQYRESIKLPPPRKTQVIGEIKQNEEQVVVLPVKKPYVKDNSRNSAYLTLKTQIGKTSEATERQTSIEQIANTELIQSTPDYVLLKPANICSKDIAESDVEVIKRTEDAISGRGSKDEGIDRVKEESMLTETHEKSLSISQEEIKPSISSVETIADLEKPWENLENQKDIEDKTLLSTFPELSSRETSQHGFENFDDRPLASLTEGKTSSVSCDGGIVKTMQQGETVEKKQCQVDVNLGKGLEEIEELKRNETSEVLPNATTINLESCVDEKTTRNEIKSQLLTEGDKTKEKDRTEIIKDKTVETEKVLNTKLNTTNFEKKNNNNHKLFKSKSEPISDISEKNVVGKFGGVISSNFDVVSNLIKDKEPELKPKNRKLAKLKISSTDSGIGSLDSDVGSKTPDKKFKKNILKNSKGSSFECEEEVKPKLKLESPVREITPEKKDQIPEVKKVQKKLVNSKTFPVFEEDKSILEKKEQDIILTRVDLILPETLKSQTLPPVKESEETNGSTDDVDFWSEIKSEDLPIVERPKINLKEILNDSCELSLEEEVKPNPTPTKLSSGLPTKEKKKKKKTEDLNELAVEEEKEIKKEEEEEVKVAETILESCAKADHQNGDVSLKKSTSEKNSLEINEIHEINGTNEIETIPFEPSSLKSDAVVDELTLSQKIEKVKIDIMETPEGSNVSIEQFAPPPSTPEDSLPKISIWEAPNPAEEAESKDDDDDNNIAVKKETNPENEDEDDDDGPKTPTNEEDIFPSNNIPKWDKSPNLSELNGKEVASTTSGIAETGNEVVASTPQTSSKKKVTRRKKSVPKTTETSVLKKVREERSPSQTVKYTKPSEATLKAGILRSTSPRSSPKKVPEKRPQELLKLFYTTPMLLLTATPRDLSKIKRAKIKRKKHSNRAPSANSDSTGSSSRSTQSTTTTESSRSNSTDVEDGVEQKRISSTRSNDSGFDGSPRLSNCDMVCHKKCEKLTGNLCGLNQKLVAEALQALKRAPSQSSDNQRNSDSSDHVHGSGRITPPATNLPRFKKYTVEDFHFLKVLGKGSFGKVLLAELRGTDCVYAVKCLKKDVVLEDDDVECTLIERKVLTLATRHPYLCHLFCTFQTDSHLFFVMEYLNGGDLMFHIQKSGRFPEFRARFYAAEIWSGLSFLHKKGIVYRDLKLDNVLLDFEGHIRIADFGMCKLQIFLDRTADTFCGTPDYMAPEIIKGLKYNQAVDWWSFGVLLYEMLTGQSPFSGCDEDELFWSICNERPFIPRYLSQEAMDILVTLLEKDAGKRPLAHDIQGHRFFHAMQWERLERRLLEPPFKPALEHTLDTRYFDTAFTAEKARLTPVPEQILTSMDQGVFRGFSYTNPNATD